jgi:hypothetical protein
MLLPIAFGTGGWLVVLGFLVVILGMAIGLFSRHGSEIEAHPRERADAPGASGRSEEAGRDEGEGSPFDTRGTA